VTRIKRFIRPKFHRRIRQQKTRKKYSEHRESNSRGRKKGTEQWKKKEKQKGNEGGDFSYGAIAQ
jgi:hypothetical protein